MQCKKGIKLNYPFNLIEKLVISCISVQMRCYPCSISIFSSLYVWFLVEEVKLILQVVEKLIVQVVEKLIARMIVCVIARVVEMLIPQMIACDCTSG